MRLIPRQFSIRTLLLGSVAVALLLSWWVSASERRRKVAHAITELNGRVTYSTVPKIVPKFAIDTLGHDYFCTIEGITLYPTLESNADEQLLTLKALPELEWLAIWPGCKGLAVAPKDPPGGLTDRGVDFLLSHLTNLQHLSLLSAQISEKSEGKLNHSSLKSLQYETQSAFGGRQGGR